MKFRNSAFDYGLVARLLHWSSVAVLLSVVTLAGQIELASEVLYRLDLINQHSLIGLCLMFIMLLRFLWRQINKNPVKGYKLHPLQKMAAMTLHRGIYAVILLQCLLGLYLWLYIPGPQSVFVYTHDVMNDLITLILIFHILAAFYHQVFGVISLRR
jgi:cytochrome b561